MLFLDLRVTASQVNSPGVLLRVFCPRVQGSKIREQTTHCPEALPLCSEITQCHQAPVKCSEIKLASSQPGSVPRARCCKEQNKNNTGSCPFIPDRGRSRSSGGRALLLGPGGDVTVCLQRQARCRWYACAVHPWVLSTISQGYRLQFRYETTQIQRCVSVNGQGGCSTYRQRRSNKGFTPVTSSFQRKEAHRFAPF